MDQRYTALTIAVPLDHEEDVKGFLLVNHEVEGFEEEPGGGMVVYITDEWSEEKHNELTSALSALGAKLVHVETVENKDWNAEWEASIEPVQITDSLVIAPSWKLEEAKALGTEHLIVIDPKMSFGTGHHETTRLCLQLLETIDCSGKTVLDVGTGTGALAMYALMRGAAHAVGIDTDDWSYQNARENRSLNKITPDQFDIRFGDLAKTVEPAERFDIVIANIHRNVLLPLAPHLFTHVHKGGSLILSGILTYDVDEVRDAYLGAGFVFSLSKQEHEWVALMFEKSDMRVAAIDIGTNTALMLIADGEADTLSVVRDEHAIPRLGEDVDKTKRIGKEAIERLDEVLTCYRQLLAEHKIDTVEAVGTSALRDASNSQEVRDHIESKFNIQVRLISGDEEARLTYLGAVSGVQADSDLIGVVDIGGGSTEIALGRGKEYLIGRSMNVGAVRLTERSQDRSQREKDIHDNLKKTFNLFPIPKKLIAVAGTATSVAVIKLGLQVFDRQKINGTQVTLAEMENIVDRLYTISPEELSKQYPAIPKGRADILPAGALILLETVRYLRLDAVTASTRGLRYGVAIDAIRRTQ
jgi:exopolyphosphatase/guanosine-5'-triphosphate,3'-diphosphate pyrophosphatase